MRDCSSARLGRVAVGERLDMAAEAAIGTELVDHAIDLHDVDAAHPRQIASLPAEAHPVTVVHCMESRADVSLPIARAAGALPGP